MLFNPSVGVGASPAIEIGVRYELEAARAGGKGDGYVVALGGRVGRKVEDAARVWRRKRNLKVDHMRLMY